MAPNSVIYARKTQDRAGFIRAVFPRWEKALRGKPIFIKPNVVSAEPYPTTTNPEALGALLDLLAGEKLVIGDSSAADLGKPGQVLRDHLLARLCRDRGLELLDLYDQPLMRGQSPRQFELEYSALPSQCGAVISMANLKAHVVVRLTGAVKNQFGFLSRSERGRLHFGRDLLHQGIAEIALLVRPRLYLVDAVETLTGANEMRHGGRRAKLGWMLAGEDPVALDAHGFRLLAGLDPKLKGLEPRDLAYLRLAREWGLGNFEAKVVEI